MLHLPSLIAAVTLSCALSLVACGGDGDQATGGGNTSTTTAGGGGQGGEAGGKPTCADVLCSGPGELCQDGECVIDCRRTGAQPCPDDTYCDASDASPGQCVGLGSPCLTTSGAQPCGDRVCGPGSICDGAGQCYPRVPCQNVDCDEGSCWGTACACERAIGCSPAPVGAPGEPATLHDPAFSGGLIDLEIDPLCNVWGVTMLSGPDYLRSIAPDGTVSTYPGVTNLNMGEVAALQHIVVPKSATTTFDPPRPPPPDDIDLALTYICCSACGCQLSSTPQGVSHFDPDTGELPLVIPSQTFTDGAGPFGVYFIDTGPAGLSYGTDRVLYVGNVDENGDYHRLDLATNKTTLVTTFPSRVHASTPFDALHMLVALEGGAIHKLRLTDATSEVWTTVDSPVTGIVRDFFDGAVYVARADSTIWKHTEDGTGEQAWTTNGPARLALSPDGHLHTLELTAPVSDIKPVFARWQLPTTR